MMMMKFFISLTLLITIAGCSEQKTIVSDKATGYTSQEVKEKNLLSNWVQSKEYFYAQNPDVHAACKLENNICITYEEYEQACKASKGVTRGASANLATGSGLDYLYRNGSIDAIDVVWDMNYRNFPCRVIMNVSGIVNGNSKRQSANQGVDAFIINNDNQILVRSTGIGQ
jgi:hypothetical protein